MAELEQIEGRNPVLEAVRAGRPLNKILVAKGSSGPLTAALAAARAAGIPVVRTEPAVLDRMAKTGHHQGIIALASPKEYTPLEEILASASASALRPLLLLLDGIMDPQNLGALIRTAEAMGVQGVILPERRAAPLSGAVERASAGALAHMPVARVTNLVRAMSLLKARGYWLIGAEAGTGSLSLPKIDRPTGLVLGGEGHGLHRLVKEECDFLVSLRMYGQINSLNVNAAGAILLHALRMEASSGEGLARR